MSRQCVVQLTDAEISAARNALECALGGDFDDASAVFGDRRSIATARRALSKLRAALASKGER